jgi:hypothetical protein
MLYFHISRRIFVEKQKSFLWERERERISFGLMVDFFGVFYILEGVTNGR